MAKQLVIVESPTKAKTLERYLGDGYRVAASKGHVRDLPADRMGVDPDRDFLPEYVVKPDSEDTVESLKKAFRGSDGLWLATDFDREGEAIAWHVAESIGADPQTANRVTFTEITRDAVRAAFEEPRRIDFALVDAQQARRILDRLVGYELSPLLQKGLKRWDLSAGRVQSVALRLIVDREREIEAFVAREYWSVDARLAPNGDESAFLARLIQVGDEKLAASPDKKGLVLSTQEEAGAHVERLRGAAYRVAEVRQREVKRTPAPPFTTSTLQQEAARKLGFSARRTMQIAQRLYEGIDLPGEGQVGLITYMRTDSVNIADQALAEIAEVVKQLYGSEYTLATPRRYKKKQRGAQEAHEAIRPTSSARNPDEMERTLDRDQARLYRLIWQRTVASQMAEARFDQISVDIAATSAQDGGASYLLRATGQTLKFDGFRRVYFEGRDDDPDEDAEANLPQLTAEQVLRLLELLPEQHFTQPPPRFTEASLVKALEENGIGRPSTYAPTLSTLVDRGYVRIEERRLFPEDIGMVVTDILVDLFPEVVDIGFTARMEEELDDIAEGNRPWATVLREFYEPFHTDVERAGDKVKPPEVFLQERCPRCAEEGREPGRLVVKLGRFGKFVGCENYPECKFTRPMEGNGQPEPELLDEQCPECGKQLMRRVGRYGPFVGCSGYPDCKYVKKEPPQRMGVTCPKCGQGELVQRRGRFGPFYSCERYPECDFSINQMPMPEPCPSCKGLVVKARGDATRCTSCGKAWAADGAELSEEEAKALVPKPRAKRGTRSARGSSTKARSGNGRRPKARAGGGGGDDEASA
ncbi:MAG TPA: type I DNA topoisomerase [Actinomycetota bacterium]|nr:type I DNA topoisomerase [Actinomycetota bacterium]